MSGGEGHHHHGHGGHGHGHDHDHHGHSHAEPAAESYDELAEREPLARGGGANQLLFLDAFSGIAGDMTMAALIDLGVPSSVVSEVIPALGLQGVSVELQRVVVDSIKACHLDVVVHEAQPQRGHSQIRDLIDGSALSGGVKARSLQVFLRLARAEAQIHGVSVDDVHFHEVGAVDAIVDIVGAVSCLDYLGAELCVAPLPMGRGSVRCQHGQLPLPAPATVLCLQGVPTYDAGIDAELVTPTGAALAGALSQRFERWPSLIPERVGFGAGTKRFADRPNVLRAVLGKPPVTSQVDSSASASSISNAHYVIIECNIDDMSGELAGHALSQLLEAGAVDAWATPVTMKKGRPGLTLSALCAAALRDGVARAMLRETTSIGVRLHEVGRVERPRRVLSVDTRFGPIAVKISHGEFGPAQIKPEFEDCARAAREHRVPVREVAGEALSAARALNLDARG